MIKKAGIILLLLIIVIQFIQPAKNNSTAILTTDITQAINVPEDVLNVLKVSCYDCHSNNTVAPWYSNIQPVGWWLNNHVKEGKSKLNFSEFGSYTPKKANHKLEEIAEMIEKNEMPLYSYTILHKDAVLNAAQKDLIIKWAKSTKIPG